MLGYISAGVSCIRPDVYSRWRFLSVDGDLAAADHVAKGEIQ